MVHPILHFDVPVRYPRTTLDTMQVQIVLRYCLVVVVVVAAAPGVVVCWMVHSPEIYS